MEQLRLFDKKINNVTSNKPILVSFRELVPEIKNSGYLTHSSHYYPAKFIPQVVRFCISKYTQKGDLIIDPFAGSGTVGLEAYLTNRNSFLLDINPLLNHIIPIKIYSEKKQLQKEILMKFLSYMKKSEYVYIPEWSNITYWYPPEILDTVSKYWGFQKNVEKNIYSKIIETSLLKVSKQFSYAEHKIPKLFRSKRKREYINNLLKRDWKKEIYESISSIAIDILNNINDFVRLTKDIHANVEYYGGVDSATYSFDPSKVFDGLITSPPYMQAQEYIRTSKLELYWLGYPNEYIKKLSKLEIPYRKPSRTISTLTLDTLKEKIERDDLKRVANSYFSNTIDALEHAMENMKKGAYSCIFIGNPTVNGIQVEIWRIFKEYFVNKGYSFVTVYEDKIKNRQLFTSRNNKNPSGMKSEFLLILRK